MWLLSDTNKILLKTEDDNFRLVIWPFAHSEVKIIVDFFACKQAHILDLE